MPDLAAPILAVLGLLALLGSVAWLTLRAAGHVGAALPPTRAEIGTLAAGGADDDTTRRQATRVRAVVERSAAIHQSVTRLAGDERLRVDALDATIEAQQAQWARERDDYVRMEMLGVNRQILEERIAAETQERRRAGMGGDHAGTD